MRAGMANSWLVSSAGTRMVLEMGEDRGRLGGSGHDVGRIQGNACLGASIGWRPLQVLVGILSTVAAKHSKLHEGRP